MLTKKKRKGKKMIGGKEKQETDEDERWVSTRNYYITTFTCTKIYNK